MAKSKKSRQKSPSAVLKLMGEPMFRQRRERDRTKYRRKEKHAGRGNARLHQKVLVCSNSPVFSHAA
ncbi:hypothetical protein EOPP23_07625 [Endozoicomonas sp. OPT23]|uniref:hypothetical protein n=1 Tax=Endozoicomonas sp. OPT23 TaxID=2072845 RepID=UPI00129B71E8|nr:hypothetical protein [Endozoicomonas sp. OPT23]MRI32853.1 hypothetical protein [Endozoicomonas sp. OPT23]